MTRPRPSEYVWMALAALLAAVAATGAVEQNTMDAELKAAGRAPRDVGLGRSPIAQPVPAAPPYAAPQTSASARTDGHYALRPTGSAVAAPSTWPQALAACMNGGSVVYEDPLTGNSIGIFCDRQVVSAAVANHNRGLP